MSSPVSPWWSTGSKEGSLEEARADVTVAKTPVASEVVPQPKKHPAAGDEPKYPLADPGDYYIGMWGKLPNYGCPHCGFATLKGTGDVEIHILTMIEIGDLKHQKALEIKKKEAKA